MIDHVTAFLIQAATLSCVFQRIHMIRYARFAEALNQYSDILQYVLSFLRHPESGKADVNE